MTFSKLADLIRDSKLETRFQRNDKRLIISCGRAIGLLLLLSLVFVSGCTSYARNDLVPEGATWATEAEEALTGTIAVYQLDAAQFSKAADDPDALIRLVSDSGPTENIGGELHYYVLDPIDKTSQRVWEERGWKSGWCWVAASGIAFAKILKIIVPRDNEEHFLMMMTLDGGVVLKNLELYGSKLIDSLASRMGNRAAKEYAPIVEAGLERWVAAELERSPAKKIVPLVEETIGGIRIPRSLGAAAVPVALRSKIGKSRYAVRLAESMSEQAQRDVDSLLAQLASGNVNPGIGTNTLGRGFFELRGSNAGRVIVRQTSAGEFDIVGKFQGHVRGDAENGRIINRLIDDYLQFAK